MLSVREDVLEVSGADRITLPSGQGSDKSYNLSDARGLHMFVTTIGFRAWRWKCRIAGKEKLLVPGSYLEVSLALPREHREAASRL
ncbi:MULTISPECIES: Arm DNA-binding domain-containing protein [unclassified Sphingomonas]|uniref:Arm DNA-binding domain-containing protein n=1 Tax=unclassified Sphingomonas TaxID=196159 RepID=UPI000ACE6942|nr:MULTISPECIES: Arm DNA-binding domain-containing protein [unclassified Sphingomonas]